MCLQQVQGLGLVMDLGPPLEPVQVRGPDSPPVRELAQDLELETLQVRGLGSVQD